MNPSFKCIKKFTFVGQPYRPYEISIFPEILKVLGISKYLIAYEYIYCFKRGFNTIMSVLDVLVNDLGIIFDIFNIGHGFSMKYGHNGFIF